LSSNRILSACRSDVKEEQSAAFFSAKYRPRSRPDGMVSASLPGPVTTVGIPFQGRTVTRDEAFKMTGKGSEQLIDETNSHAQDLDVGRIRIRDGCMGDRWKIGPLIFDWDGEGEHHPKERWLRKRNRQRVRHNGRPPLNCKMERQLTIGRRWINGTRSRSDSFSYTPTEIKTASRFTRFMSPKTRLRLTLESSH